VNVGGCRTGAHAPLEISMVERFTRVPRRGSAA